MRQLLFIPLLLLVGCVQPTGSMDQAPNKWASGKMLSVLEAQEHRDTDKLCSLLANGNDEVREAAALAFASVQDSTSIPCLLNALSDSSVVVRSAAVFAIGFIADSTIVSTLTTNYAQETDSMVRSAYHSALVMAAHHMPGSRSVEELVSLMEKSIGQDRARVADALRRVDANELNRISDTYFKLINDERDSDTKAFLVRGLAKSEDPRKDDLLRSLLSVEQPIAVRVNAARVLGSSNDAISLNELARNIVDPELTLRTAILEALDAKAEQLDPKILLQIQAQVDQLDPITRLNYYALLFPHNTTKGMARDTIRRMMIREPYAEAARFTAMAADEEPGIDATMNAIMLSDAHPAMSYAAYRILAERTLSRMNKPRATPHSQQVEEAAPFFRSVMETGNPGLISAAAEDLQVVHPKDLTTLFPKDLEMASFKSLKAIQDLEARSLIATLAAKRDGAPIPEHPVIAFNHPIDTMRLKQLQQGQRYTIRTKKGTIIIATDVNGAPGSCLAFDSLVTAGYYNGKAFHRMVPNFVAQGGCPRGDGYGGMPWTLRTEISRNLFTTGSLGLASAGRDTESCQFFITHSATPHLDGRYTRFGEVVNGMNVVLKLQVGDVMESIERTVN
ncbi:MAG: peptidylprolyl isomerase [Flavobacteriales bacterium]|nr:peptidylprolyl isomerase [Flavobacteriales bacterium]MBK6944242.1 peptidylprolyl isomerase [Flavobacteriales bacterium]MBK7240442.1 peptidylprolyl isomerase [Flavobacteriales bacterium]MBK9533908.1 peptidylprolyl isomerase [Flavobacteriales bacterium]MBP9139026.1 peptidylprolyl isomerase [Flavobacteriales bacterium]